MRAAIALGVLLAALPAHAGWQRTVFVDGGGQPASLPPQQQLRAVGGARPVPGAPARVWAVGGNGTLSSLLVSSSDGFAHASAVPDCASLPVAMHTLWVAPDASFVHAFGRNQWHASWDGASWSCSQFSPPGGISNLNVASAAFESPTSGYLGGSAVTGGNFLGRWTGSLANVTPSMLYGPVEAIAHAPTSDRWFFASTVDLYRVGVDGRIATGPGQFSALAFQGDSGIAVSSLASGTRLIDAATDTVTVPPGLALDFEPVKGVALTAGGFAVAVGNAAGSTTEGALAQSYDGGKSWRRIDLAPLGAVGTLAGVACWDENSCAAVGSLSDGSGGFVPEMLFYDNGAPGAVVTANGQALSEPLPDDATICLSAVVTDPEGDPASWTWRGAGIEGSTAADAPCFPAPVSCAPQLLSAHALDLTDGRRGATQPLTLSLVHAPRPPSAPVLSPAPAAGTFQWRAGELHTLTASATPDCNRPLSFEFEGQGSVPAPTVQGSAATFDLASLGCSGGTGSVLVRALDSDPTVAPVETQYPVVVSGWVVAPTIGSPLAGSVVRVAPGASAQVVAQASHCSGSAAEDFTYRWSCDGAQTGATLTLDNPGTATCEQRFACDLEVTPVLPGQPSATVRFEVVLEAGTPPAGLTLERTPATASLAPGGQVEVVPRPSGLCEPTLLWSCTGTDAPQPGTAERWTFLNPVDQCAIGAYVDCLVTATSQDGTRSASASLRLDLERQLQETTASVSFQPAQPAGPVLLAPGEAVVAQVGASSTCPTTYTWSWDCGGTTNAPAPGTSTATFVNTHAGCETQEVRCVATAQPPDGPGASVAVELVLKPTLAPPPDVTLELEPFDGVEVRAQASTPAGECIAPGDFAWTAVFLSAPGVAVASGRGPQFRLRPEVCGRDELEIRVRERASGIERTATLQLEGNQEPPRFLDPQPVRYEHVLDCNGPALRIPVPDVTASCTPAYAWVQRSGPLLVAHTRPDGALEVVAPSGSLSGLLGKTAVFELTVTSTSGSSAPKTVEVTFVPTPFVRLGHLADRTSAARGEPVRFTVEVSSRCEATLEAGADLHLQLEGLEYVRGSARLEGVGLQEPEIVSGDLVFRGVTVPAAGEAPLLLRYVARRRTTLGGSAASRALAYLTAAPTLRISEEASARQGAGPAVGALSCQCTEAGGGLGAWFALAALAGLGARRRARRPC